MPVRNLSSATQLRQVWFDGPQTAPGSKAEQGRGIEFANPRTPDVDGERDPSQAVVGSEVSSGDALVPMMESAEVRKRHDTLNPFVERVIGSIRRECLDHFLVLNERHLHRLLRAYLAYYNAARPHQALDQNSPHPRSLEPPSLIAST